MKKKSANEKQRRFRGRRVRVARKLAGGNRVQLTVFRSARHTYAQLVDPEGKTLTTVSTRSREVLGDLEKTGNVEAARRVGAAIAAAARERQIEQVVFNRNGFLYHGRVKAVGEAAREAGLRF